MPCSSQILAAEIHFCRLDRAQGREWLCPLQAWMGQQAPPCSHAGIQTGASLWTLEELQPPWAVPTRLCSFISHQHKCNVNNLQLLGETINLFSPLIKPKGLFIRNVYKGYATSLSSVSDSLQRSTGRQATKSRVTVSGFQARLGHFRAGSMWVTGPLRVSTSSTVTLEKWYHLQSSHVIHMPLAGNTVLDLSLSDSLPCSLTASAGEGTRTLELRFSPHEWG